MVTVAPETATGRDRRVGQRGQIRPRQAAVLPVVDCGEGVAGEDVEIDVQPPTRLGRGDPAHRFGGSACRIAPPRRHRQAATRCLRAIPRRRRRAPPGHGRRGSPRAKDRVAGSASGARIPRHRPTGPGAGRAPCPRPRRSWRRGVAKRPRGRRRTPARAASPIRRHNPPERADEDRTVTSDDEESMTVAASPPRSAARTRPRVAASLTESTMPSGPRADDGASTPTSPRSRTGPARRSRATRPASRRARGARATPSVVPDEFVGTPSSAIVTSPRATRASVG